MRVNRQIFQAQGHKWRDDIHSSGRHRDFRDGNLAHYGNKATNL